MLFARYAKKPVQAVHSPLESDGMIGKSIIWSVIAVRRFTWIWSLNYDARILEGYRGYCEKKIQVLRHENVPLKLSAAHFLKHYTFPLTLKKN